MKFIISAALALLIGSTTVFAVVSDIEVNGVLVSYNKKIAMIKTAHGIARVPRNSLPNLDGYIAGKAHVTAHVLPSDLVRLNMKNKNSAAVR